VSTDPLERARAMLNEAAIERDNLRGKLNTAETEIHQLRRRLARTEDGYREVSDLNDQLKRQITRAEQVAEQARRAMLDHAART
jgi:septal ring factor EnvC (AmiA/AmiB activator)